MISRWIGRSFTLLLPLALLAVANAQVNRYATMEMASVMLMGSQNVQKELKLSPSQSKTVNSSFREYAETAQRLMKAYQKDKGHYDKYNLQLRAAQKKLISACLLSMNVSQTSRLKQIGLQHYGIFSVTQADIAKEIGMSAIQLANAKKNYMTYWNTMDTVSKARAAQIRAVPQPKNVEDKAAVAAYQKKVQELARLSRDVDNKKITDMQKQMEKKTEAMLTKAQLAKFNALKGRPFKDS